MNIVKAAFIKTVIIPTAKYFWNWGEKLDEMAEHVNPNNLAQLAKFESEYAKFTKEFNALPKAIREMVGETRKSWLQ